MTVDGNLGSIQFQLSQQQEVENRYMFLIWNKLHHDIPLALLTKQGEVILKTLNEFPVDRA